MFSLELSKLTQDTVLQIVYGQSQALLIPQHNKSLLEL